MPKKIKTANKKKYKKKINKSKTNKKHNAGVREYLIDSKIPITQLDQIKLPRDITNKIFTHLAAIKIQDRFNKKYLERIKTILKMISLNDLKIFYTALKHFINSVKTTGFAQDWPTSHAVCMFQNVLCPTEKLPAALYFF